ncbi:MAG: hypothetical protein A3D10_00550 [Omnitrophica WOR_2 bacterium RIFCSPHIGHO2_02_FULL_48_11]|nr:MAG: hypothetical protein A3D10_00550 [Omnitrophica WOR_2 bacterium RIFCSPHIGHO2_02_FULL_48_11]
MPTPEYKTSICSWPSDDRPRERLLKYGEHKLTNTELLAILLRTGIKGESAVDLARKLLDKFKTFRAMSHTDSRDWDKFKGLGPAKISQIKAALEIGRRFREDEARVENVQIKSAQDLVTILMPRLRDLKKEVFKVAFLDGQNRVLAIEDLDEGTVNYASPVIREIYHRALQHFATAMICLHNHPSGKPVPSVEDRQFTRKLIDAGLTLGVKILDHIIIGDNAFYSFAEKGEM